MSIKAVSVDGVKVPIEGESNLLEVIRKANVNLPTFCYHSEISVYGACRMCMVDINGRGIAPACSTKPEDGMVIRTNTQQIRGMRKVIVELLLASHDQNCTTCPKSGECRLQSIARQLGVDTIRFKRVGEPEAIDSSSKSIIRDPGKCILCGDCVRVCSEIQSVGALDFAYRGAQAKVVTCFNKGMGDIECVNCGQCVKVCPVGALTPKWQINEVWKAVYDEKKIVVVQIAPAVRVSLGEHFGCQPGTTTTGQIVSALKRMGFDYVYDTCFGADFTVVEEAEEFLERRKRGEKLPMFTSCCPAWVKFAEQYYPDMLTNLSSCKSPQQMFGALCKDRLSKQLGVSREDIVIVSIMPCVAKKFEAGREEFKVDGNPDVDYVLTTSELALMVKEIGMDFNKLELSSFDMPFGFATGAAVIFGSSGGVAEAVLRYAANKLQKGSYEEFRQVRGSLGGAKSLEIDLGGETLRLAVASGLANARKLIDKVRSGEEQFDLIEVMACCGGCINGGGQPPSFDGSALAGRAKGLGNNDKMLQFHVSSENPYLQQIYHEDLDSKKAHALLHTTFENRKRIEQEDIVLSKTPGEKRLKLNICFGTSCYVRGAQALYSNLMDYIRDQGLEEDTEFTASFCGKQCRKGPVASVNGKALERCTLAVAVAEIEKALLLNA